MMLWTAYYKGAKSPIHSSCTPGSNHNTTNGNVTIIVACARLCCYAGIAGPVGPQGAAGAPGGHTVSV